MVPLPKDSDVIPAEVLQNSIRGSTAEEALEICLIVGAHPKVVLVDVSEFGPKVVSLRTGNYYQLCLLQETTNMKMFC